MEYSTYLKRRIALEDKIKKLEESYIKSNMKFKVGTKVRVIHRDGTVEYGFIKGYNMVSDTFVKPIIAKMKKDGTPSKVGRVWYKWNEIISKA